MGIIDFVKGGIRELAIARPEDKKNWIIYKHTDRTVPNHAQLTIAADEVALFIRDGKLVGQLEPGRHTMESKNIMFLDQIVDWGTGGNLWTAEVYFVTTREIPTNKFGGKIGTIRDPQSGLPVEVMVNGTFSFKVIDAPKLVIGLAGLGRPAGDDDDALLGWFKEQVLKVIKDDIATLCVQKKWPLLDVTSGAYTEEICDDVVKGCHKYCDSYGLEVMGIGNFNLAMKDEDEKRLKKLYETSAYVNMAGGMQGYQQMASAQAMMAAGDAMKDNPGGGGGGGGNPLLAGAGLGIGMGMAQSFQQGGGGGQQQPGRGFTPVGGAPAQAQGGAASIVCPACQKTVAPGKFCAECGGPLAAAGPKFCSGCGNQLAAGSKFCSGCGAQSA